METKKKGGCFETEWGGQGIKGAGQYVFTIGLSDWLKQRQAGCAEFNQ